MATDVTFRLVSRLRRALGGIVAALALAVSASPAFATQIGPSINGYVATDSVTYNFVDISTTGTRVLSNTDDTSSTQNLGFTFKFFAANYTTVSVSSNGILTFNGITNNQWVNVNFNSTTTTNNGPTIAGFYDDLDFRTSNDANADGVYVQTIGSTVGSRTFVAQWNKAAHYPQAGVRFTGEVTFEIILSESSNSILFEYKDATWSGATGYDYGGSATVGIRDTSGQTNGRRLQWSFNSGVLANNYAILFHNPEPGTIALFGTGAAGLAAAVWSRRRKRRKDARGGVRTL